MEQDNKHQILLLDRTSMEVTGVIAVESFDSEEFLLQTECGYLGIKGKELSLRNLDLEQGKVYIDGEFIECGYLDTQTPNMEKTKKVLGRLFK